jgi:hypothetical protein
MVRRAIVRQTSNYKPAFSELQASFQERPNQRSGKDSFYEADLSGGEVIVLPFTEKSRVHEGNVDGMNTAISGLPLRIEFWSLSYQASIPSQPKKDCGLLGG